MAGDKQKKKDGQRKDKKTERMREDVKERHERAGGGDVSTDEGDIYTKRQGSMGEVTTGPNKPR